MPSVHSVLLFALLLSPISLWAQSKWIWLKDSRLSGAKIEFSREFELSGHAVSGRLQAVADFSFVDIRINGKSIGQTSGLGPLFKLDVSRYLLK